MHAEPCPFSNYDIVWKKTDGSAVGTGIFNGDVGTITSIDPNMETMTVVFDDREADYDFTQLGELEPVYAMTVHKSQGSEYRAVVLSCWNGSPYLLSRSVLYTAIRFMIALMLIGLSGMRLRLRRRRSASSRLTLSSSLTLTPIFTITLSAMRSISLSSII